MATKTNANAELAIGLSRLRVHTYTANRRMFVRSGIIVHESIARTYTSGCGNDADDAATVEKNESNAS